MEHFSEQVWADFVRGIGQSKMIREVEGHLAGCPDCRATREVWKNVVLIANTEATFMPPDGLVRIAKQELATTQLGKPSVWTLANLQFDSFSQPLPAGVRSGGSAGRQLVFDAETTMVDLVLELRPQSKTISLAGQVVDKSGTRVAPRRVSVILWTETALPLAETSANEFGEFQLEFAAQDRLRISIEIAGRKPIRIPPINLTPEVMRPITEDSGGHY
jgi:hypothetical protein